MSFLVTIVAFTLLGADASRLKGTTAIGSSTASYKGVGEGACDVPCTSAGGMYTCHDRMVYEMSSMGRSLADSLSIVNSQCVGQCACTGADFTASNTTNTTTTITTTTTTSKDTCTMPCSIAGEAYSCHDRAVYVSTTISLCAAMDMVNQQCDGQCACTLADFGVKPWTRINATRGLAPAGPAEGGPDTPTDNVDIPPEVAQCKQKYAPQQIHGQYGWTFEQIAAAFYEYSIDYWNFPSHNMNASMHVGNGVAALVIVAGECSPIGWPSATGCSSSPQFSKSGVFQTDFLLTGGAGSVVEPQVVKDGGVMNLCLSAYGAGFLAAPFPKSMADGNGRVNTLHGGSYFTCRGANLDVGFYGCPDGARNAPMCDFYPNFIGPFCHKGWESSWSSCVPHAAAGCCGVWNGGSNFRQDVYPFPDFYYAKARQANGDTYSEVCQKAAAEYMEEGH